MHHQKNIFGLLFAGVDVGPSVGVVVGLVVGAGVAGLTDGSGYVLVYIYTRIKYIHNIVLAFWHFWVCYGFWWFMSARVRLCSWFG